ncbi:MAG: hypothetical protein KME42_23720 [Tildeniella nuda ZEHNDER 1965/U140]|jgi:hypothetical protein|nr:hypothetical protein [Tildeniella nuda ZEHNDER 1965/U140]
MIQNRVSATLSASDKTTVVEAIETLKTAMPFLTSFTADERKALPKTGDRSRGFILNALEVAQRHNDCLPRSFDIEEMQKDVQLMEDLHPILMAITQLQSVVNDTYTAANCEAYTAALKVYDCAKAHKDMPGMETVVEQLKQQFARRTKKASTPTPVAALAPALA